MERRFFAEHVQSDAHYQMAGFALYILTGAYAAYLGVGLGLHAYYGLRRVSSLPSLLIPFLPPCSIPACFPASLAAIADTAACGWPSALR